jgi:hypothetical protein
MKTIKNKKGNTGFMVLKHWNAHEGSIDLKEKDFFVEYCIQEVEVVSCGKVQMCCFVKDNRRNARQHFDPETPIYETLEDAKVAAESHFPNFIADSINRLQYRVDNYDGSNDEWIQQFIDALQEYKEGLPKLKIITKTEWLQEKGFI